MKILKLTEAKFDATKGQKFSSAKTALSNDARAKKTGTIPALYAKAKFEPKSKNLDYGCGTPNTANAVDKYLAGQDVQNYHYDRQYFPNTAVFQDNFYDTVTASNLLNVVPEDVRAEIISNAYDVLVQGGKFYATVGYVKDYVIDAETGKRVPSGVGAEMEKDDSFQANLDVKTYFDEIEKVFGKGNVKKKSGMIEATK